MCSKYFRLHTSARSSLLLLHTCTLPRFHPLGGTRGGNPAGILTSLTAPPPITLHTQCVPHCTSTPTQFTARPWPPPSPAHQHLCCTTATASFPISRPPLLPSQTHPPPRSRGFLWKYKSGRATPLLRPFGALSLPRAGSAASSPAPSPASFIPSYAGVTAVLQTHQSSPCLRAFALAPSPNWSVAAAAPA